MAEYATPAADQPVQYDAAGDTRLEGAALTREEIVAQIDELTSYIEDWRNTDDDPSLFVQYRGEMVKAISQAIESLAVQLFELVHTMNVEPSAWELVLAIDEVEDRFLTWATENAAVGAYPAGTHDMWAQYDRMLTKREPAKYPLPEPIEALVAQKVSMQQIAKIYGWYMDPGTYLQPDTRKVAEELANPGTHFKVDEWEPISEARKRAKIVAAWEQRAKRIEASPTLGTVLLTQGGLAEEDKPKPEPIDAPETVEELVLQRVPTNQILKMKPGVTEEEVRTIAAQIGVALDGRVVRHVNPVEQIKEQAEQEQQAQDEDLQLAKQEAHLELDAVEDRIWAVHQDGKQPTEVLAILKRHHIDLSIQKVVGVINSKRKALEPSPDLQPSPDLMPGDQTDGQEEGN